MNLYERVVQTIKAQRKRALEGKANCIPFPYRRFSRSYPGLEKSRYIVVTGNQKTAKSKWTDFTFLYESFFYMLEHPGEYTFKGFVFTLEMSKDFKVSEFMSHLLYRITSGTMKYSPRELSSVDKDRALPEEVLKVIEGEEFKSIMDKWLECVEYIDDIRNPTGVNKYLRQWALDHGHFEKKTGPDGVERIDRYIPDDPNLYKIVVIDNAANLTLESGYSERENIVKLSKYAITLRDQLEYSIILIQHQTSAQESLENFKYGKVKPSSSGLGDAKTTSRDANMIFGIFSPVKFEIKNHLKYDITRLMDHARFVEVLEDRDGGAAGHTIPLMFDGAVTVFEELPLPGSPALESFYREAESLESDPEQGTLFMTFSSKKREPELPERIKGVIFVFLSKIKNFLIWQ